MEELKINAKTAKQAYQQASKKGKELLETIFGQNALKELVTDRIKSFEDVLADHGITPAQFWDDTKNLSPDEVAFRQIKLIAQSLNEGWQPNWDDDDEYKYYPWFYMRSSSGFSFDAYAYDGSYSGVGSRLVFKSSKLAEYAGKQFKDIYEALFTTTPTPVRKFEVYTDIKTFDDALAYTGESLESFKHRTQFDTDQQRASKELEVIAQAIRFGNELGTEEGDPWYYPWFNAARSSSGFSFDDCDCDDSHSVVGSRHCVENADKAKYMGRQFLAVYDRYING